MLVCWPCCSVEEYGLSFVGFTSDAKRAVFRAIHKANALSYFTQPLSTTPVAAKPGYDPLHTHWSTDNSNSKLVETHKESTLPDPAHKRRKRGPQGTLQ